MQQKRNDREEYIRILQSEIDNDESYRALLELQRQENELGLKYEENKKQVSELERVIKESVKRMEKIVGLGRMKEAGLNYIDIFGNISQQSDTDILCELQEEIIAGKPEAELL